MEQAAINIQEAQADTERELGRDDLDPAQLSEIEARLSLIYDVARKHRITPEEITSLHEQLKNELAQLQSGDEQIDSLQNSVAEYEKTYFELAEKLSECRKQSAEKLSGLVDAKLKGLAMEHAHFCIALNLGDGTPNMYGNESVQFLISTAPGQEPKALNKIASGGELSRISLAIQVITAQTSTTPTLVFDEVDVGIGGTTGDVVGGLLRELGHKGQVLCVTHLAQVASKAHHHLLVEKALTSSSVSSSLKQLNDDAKVAEVARMMGGAIDSEQSLAHAKEMLEQAECSSKVIATVC